MSKDSFIIFHSLYKPIEGLTDEQMGKLFRAIFEYEINGVECAEDDIKMAFLFFKNSLDVNRKKYNERCEKNRKNIEKRWSKE